MTGSPPGTGEVRLERRDFERLAELIEKYAGIRMPATKRTMLEGRLRRRLREGGFESYERYCTYLFKEGGLDQELTNLIDVITTNKTEFFREPNHFEFLVQRIVPELLRAGVGVPGRPLRVWSSACSTGPEPYTMAMVLADLAQRRPGFEFQILASDISTQVLRVARRAVYPLATVEPVPSDLHRRYLMRSRDRSEALVRVVPELRAKVEFRQLNLMDADYRLPVPQNVVFCRNVMIYFDLEVRRKVLERLCAQIPVGGYLVLGHSETLTGVDLPLQQVVPTVHVRCPA